MSTESETSTVPYEEDEIDDDIINETLKDDNDDNSYGNLSNQN